MRTVQQIISFLKKAYSPDQRALALMRIGMALIIIADLLIRGADLSAHYTDAGIWPINLVKHFAWKSGYWSIHTLWGEFTPTLVLFVLHFLLAILLLIGSNTRLITFLLFVFTVSLHNRNLFVLQAGDDLLRLVLLWGLFLPWGNHYSLDSKRKKYRTVDSAFANAGYLLLVSSVYLFAVALRNTAEWHEEGSAVYFALSLEQIRLPLGTVLYNHPALLKILTRLVYYTEFLIPILILLPTKKQIFRFVAFLLIFFLHLGFGLTLYVGLFYLIGIVSAFGLLPSNFFDRLDDYAGVTHSRTSNPNSPALFKILLNGFCAMLIGICLLINLSNLKWFNYKLKSELSVFANGLRLDQYWGMFSPGVLRKDGWYVYHGFDSIGRQWDIRLNQDYVDYEKPQSVVGMYTSDRWRKLAENMQDDRFTFLRPLYCKFRLNEWNHAHPERQLAGMNLYFMEKLNLPDYKTKKPTKQLYCVCTNY
ncbi:MAG: hypothetical protein PSX36_01385 [bacterium]|nr:hypothetical protein [bacterium]